MLVAQVIHADKDHALANAKVQEPFDSAPVGETKPADPIPGALQKSPRRHPAKQTVSVRATLVPIGSTLRHRIRVAYRTRGGRFRRLNDTLRALLSEAIFQVENDLEHRQPQHPQVAVMLMVRNRLYDDLGWNEPLPSTRHP